LATTCSMYKIASLPMLCVHPGHHGLQRRQRGSHVVWWMKMNRTMVR